MQKKYFCLHVSYENKNIMKIIFIKIDNHCQLYKYFLNKFKIKKIMN